MNKHAAGRGQEQGPATAHDSRIQRESTNGLYTTGYRTRDGRFTVENGLAGMYGGARTGWTIHPNTADAGDWLTSLPDQGGIFARKRDAVEFLRESFYADRAPTPRADDDEQDTVMS